MGCRAYVTLRNALIAATSVVAFALFVTPFAGADQNETLSIDSLTIAAQQGDAEAQYQLGKHYWDDYLNRLLHTAGEYEEGRWLEALAAEVQFRMAAEQGHAEAAQRLGRIYSFGWPGLPKFDYHEAVKWLRMAAEKGHPMSQSDLGLHYENGQGVPQDYLLALMWYNLAAAGIPVASPAAEASVFPCIEPRTYSVRSDCTLAIIKLRDALSAKMTPDQIAEAQRMAREWLEQHPAERQQ